MISKYFEDAPLNIPVKYKIRQIANKMEILDREIKYLLNKVKIWKPKQEAAANQTTDSKAERVVDENESAADSDTEKDKSTEEQPSDNLEEQQQEPVTETTDTTQDPVLLPESEKSQLLKEKVQEQTHQEL